MATSSSGITAEHIRAEVKRLIAEITEREPEEITDTASFGEDLGIDSLTGMEIMLAIDVKLKTNLPDQEFAKMKNVDDVVALIQQHLPQ